MFANEKQKYYNVGKNEDDLMKIVIASDSYKGCMTSLEVANIMKKAILNVDPSIDVTCFPVGDGGEGTLDAFVEVCKGTYEIVNAKEAYGKEVQSKIGWIESGTTAIIEISSIIGLHMYAKEKRNALYASSYGVGQLLLHVKRKGCKKIILALGGSATNDGGMGLLCALGVRFYDEQHKPLKAMASNLAKIEHIDITHMEDFSDIECIAACDVKNTLLGIQGATHIFGKQKGLFPNQIKKVEKAMAHYAMKMKDVGFCLDEVEGGGAAGGIGSIFLQVLHAQMQPGIKLLFSYNNIEEAIKHCDLVITGEGQSDKQTLYGKVPMGVITIANTYNKPCICISGALGLEYKKLYDAGFIGIYSIADRAMSFSQAISHAPEKLEAATYTIMKTIIHFKRG